MRTFTEGNVTMYEIYDCGVVFYPEHPYLLCGAAQSGDRDKLQGFFKSLGWLVYKEMNYEYNTN